MKNELRVYFAIWTAAVALALPGRACGAEAVTARPPAAQAWNVEVRGSYAATTDFTGWGIALRGGWRPVPYFAVGFGIETTRLHAEGMMTSSGFLPARPYSQTFNSTFPSAFLRVQLPLRHLTPYSELGAGWVFAHSFQGENVECAYGNGPGAEIGIGVDAQIVPSLAAGLRAGVRNPGWGVACALAVGPWSYQGDSMMRSLALTTSYRW